MKTKTFPRNNKANTNIFLSSIMERERLFEQSMEDTMNTNDKHARPVLTTNVKDFAQKKKQM